MSAVGATVQSEARERPPQFEVRVPLPSEVEAIFADGGLGAEFFAESEFETFTELDLVRARESMIPAIEAGHILVLTGYYRGEMSGFIMFTVTRFYTADPMGQLMLFYVRRRRRLSPLGRDLMAAAELVAKTMGACVFYSGATAGCGERVDAMMMNMLDKRGYVRLGGVSRKILRETT